MTSLALTIAGSDPSGGAGLQADLKTFHQHRVYGMSVVTLLTVQNTTSVRRVETMPVELVAEQLDAVLTDLPPDAAKTGALGDVPIIELLAERSSGFSFPLVVDPVMISKHGHPLISPDAIQVLKERLLPHCFLVTPNLPEVEALCGIEVGDVLGMRDAAKRMSELGPQHVLIKGGHLTWKARGAKSREEGQTVDVLWSDGELIELKGTRYETPHTHGTGCVYSAAITARLARGEDMITAVHGAKGFIDEAIRTNPGLGSGQGPCNLFVE